MLDDSAENRMLDGPNHFVIKRQYWISQTKTNNERYVFVTVRILAQKCTAGLYEKLGKTDENDKSLCSLRNPAVCFFRSGSGVKAAFSNPFRFNQIKGNGAPGETRTRDPLLRSRSTYFAKSCQRSG